jgi:hypothetical protein
VLVLRARVEVPRQVVLRAEIAPPHQGEHLGTVGRGVEELERLSEPQVSARRLFDGPRVLAGLVLGALNGLGERLSAPQRDAFLVALPGCLGRPSDCRPPVSETRPKWAAPSDLTACLVRRL